MSEHLISANNDGSLIFIYNDELAFLSDLGQVTTARASHVEPTPEGEWTADMSPVNGPLLGPFKLRGEALKAETNWIQENVL